MLGEKPFFPRYSNAACSESASNSLFYSKTETTSAPTTPLLRSFRTSNSSSRPRSLLLAVAFAFKAVAQPIPSGVCVSHFEAERSAGCVARAGRDQDWPAHRWPPPEKKGERRGRRTKVALQAAPGRESGNRIWLRRRPERDPHPDLQSMKHHERTSITSFTSPGMEIYSWLSSMTHPIMIYDVTQQFHVDVKTEQREY